MDIVDAATRSRMMSNIRSANTKPEIAVRRFLHARGFRFRLHSSNIIGRPDIVLPKWNSVIFVHGCFWHRHINCNKTTNPSTNTERWNQKFSSNGIRDKTVRDMLLSNGWNVIVIWECGLGKSSDFNDLDWLVVAIKSPNKINFIEWPIKN